MRLYLDNCSFNRPYDDLSLFRNYLEAEAKMYIQKGILQGKFELAWSFIIEFEISFNPFVARKNQISKWKNIAKFNIGETEQVLAKANEFVKKHINTKDALHLACAIEAGCDYFITTDDRILNKPIEHVMVINPIDFVRIMEV